MSRKLVLAVLPILAIIAIPLVLRRTEVEDRASSLQLVVVSPHNEAIRFEFEQAFRRHCAEALGLDVDIDWRAPGGTTEIVRFLESSYLAAFRLLWEADGKAWTNEVESACLNRRLRREDATDTAWAAREAFLTSQASVGIDVFFGGGQFDLGRLAEQGLLVPCGYRDRHPETLAGDTPILSQRLSGEIWYDPQDRYYGACLSSFGICSNLDSLADLGYDITQPASLPRQWRDLADPRLFGQVGAADPSKSGSINKCFEMILQQAMAAEVARRLPQGADQADPAALREAVAEGWAEALLLVRQIGGNARYFTMSASKVPVDVARGELAAGMCIDFYGTSQADWEREHVGRQTMLYVTPEGGSSLSVDPIGILRGAPHRDLAETFVDFVLSRPGQQLWNYRVGTPGGPVQYALRRLPVRRDLYTDADRAHMSEADARPFDLAGRFQYHPEWTGRYFDLIRVLIRVMVIDCHPELKEAWRAVVDAGGPAAAPEAMALLRELPFTYAEADAAAADIRLPRSRVARTRAWAEFFRDRYRRAAKAAGRP
ncbi:MAG: ABC transporter substrate-binding protein [Lentisphaerae bacterium]|nr:ABC transporter substrate-binding protein [Lentisphaerota bacterium]